MKSFFVFGLLAFAFPVHPAHAEVCSPEKVAKAPVGFTCAIGDVTWQVAARTKRGHVVVKDLKRNLLVSDIGFVVNGYEYPGGKDDGFSAQNDCSKDLTLDARGGLAGLDWHLPSGYPQERNGQASRWIVNGLPGAEGCPPLQKLHDGHCFFPDQDSDWVTLDRDGIRSVAHQIDNDGEASSSWDAQNT